MKGAAVALHRTEAYDRQSGISGNGLIVPVGRKGWL